MTELECEECGCVIEHLAPVTDSILHKSCEYENEYGGHPKFISEP